MDPARLALVVALAAGVAALVVAWNAAHRRDRRRGVDGLPPVPAQYVGPGPTTWLVFTTPYCATCGPVEEHLRRTHPDHTVRRVDVGEHAELATRYEIKRAPTVLEVDGTGSVRARLVGAEGVHEHLAVS